MRNWALSGRGGVDMPRIHDEKYVDLARRFRNAKLMLDLAHEDIDRLRRRDQISFYIVMVSLACAGLAVFAMIATSWQCHL